MDIQQLKLLAGSTRALLERSDRSVNHSQSLDLVAALPGLRTWPEVVAFPDRVAATELDLTSTGRLSFRLKKRFDVELTPQELLAALSPPGATISHGTLQIWPAGPVPGVYVTTEQDAIDALLDAYEDATDGALIYAERAGNRRAGSIDLGDHGLWSAGLDRVPSGTLLVLGPLKLNQQSWESTAERLEMACNHALNSGHRVAVLLDTPTPEMLHEDICLMVSSRPGFSDHDEALMGVVTDDGELEACTPFAKPWPSIQLLETGQVPDAFPLDILTPLEDVLRDRKNGLLLFGSATLSEHWAADLIAASLALTEHCGPAARIMARHRTTEAKDWDVPEAIRRLPFLPSMESAYAQGYRRLIYHPSYTTSEQLLTYSNDTMLISGSYGTDPIEVFMDTMRAGGRSREEELLGHVIAIAATVCLPTKGGDTVIGDLYVANGQPPAELQKFDEIARFIEENLVVRWHDALSRLLDGGVISANAVKKAFERNRGIAAFLDERAKKKKRLATA